MTTVRHAFSMLEVLVTVLIIGIGASLVMPRLTRRTQESEWPAIQGELNTLLYFARQEAVSSQKTHRISCDKREGSVRVEVLVDSQKDAYEPTSSAYFDATYTLPKGVEFVTMKRDKKDLFVQHRGMGRCMVMPQGVVQEALITLRRVSKNDIEDTRTFKVEPFLGEWRQV